MWRLGSKQKVIVQALGIAQGTVSKVLKRNRETGVRTPRARPGRPRKTTEREDCYLLRLCRNWRTKSANTLRAEWLRFTNSIYPCIQNAS
jgi:transposase